MIFSSLFQKQKIESFETVLLRTTGMRYATEYEITVRGADATVSQYEIVYRDGKDVRDLRRSALCGAARIVRLMNDCGVLSWDGFYGKHPKGVRDGTMFTFDATVNGEKRIRASGSQNFPKHFREFMDGLREILEGGESNGRTSLE